MHRCKPHPANNPNANDYITPKFAGRGLQPCPASRREKGLDEKVCIYLDSFKINPTYNTDGWGNKLVTIFARHLDNYILTPNFSLICQIRDFGSGQILQQRQFYLSPGLAKIAPWWLARRDNFLPKVPGLVSADGTTNVYSLNRRAVRRQSFALRFMPSSLENLS